MRAAAPLVAFLLSTILLSLALTHGEDAAGSAAYAQTDGATRGPIVDRVGRPLVWTAGVVPTRRYAVPGLAPVLGFRDPERAWTGLEEKYGPVLAGARARADWKTFFLNLRGVSARGGTLQLTLDARVQRTAARALGQGPGAVVALDPRTGAVLAMVTKPSCSTASLYSRSGLLRCSRDRTRPLLNRATQLLVAPGSAFKIVTLTAALDTRRFTLDSVFSGADVFGPSPYFNNVTYPSNVTRSDLSALTLAQALAFSDNFTFAHIGLTLGAPTFLQYAHRFYVGKRIPFDLPVAVSHAAGGDSHPSLSVLAKSSFGAGTDRVTPLQMAMIVSAVADGGVLMAPHLVREARTASGKVLYRYRPHRLDRVMSQRAAAEVTRGMEFVVNHGSGFEAAISGVPVAGKTGTAASAGKKPNAWFISFAPANRPRVAVAVLHEFSGEGFSHAAPIARKVMLAALREGKRRAR